MLKPQKASKKPIVVEWIQWQGCLYPEENDNLKSVKAFCNQEEELISTPNASSRIHDGALTLNTKFHGYVKVNKNDVIIKGAKGEFYPCDWGVFKETYDYEHIIGEDS